MNILIVSYAFFPGVGGIEMSSELLARGFVNTGHKVRVVTRTRAGAEEKKFPYDVIRRPDPWRFCKQIFWSDVVFHNNISLNLAWPLLFIRRPWVIAHHTWLCRVNGGMGWQDQLKRFLIRFAMNIVNSQAIASDLHVPCTVIGNAYDDDVFCRIPEVSRDKELVFVGRLVSDKGIGILLAALTLLKERGRRPSLTVVGDGPERKRLEALVCDSGMDHQVHFAGVRRGRDLATLLNRHKIMVVPSQWREPFGIVALEGIACGCVVVGTQGGGLPEAIGPCGMTVPNGDVEALAQALAQLLFDEALLASYERHTVAHAARHTVSMIGEEYLQVLEKAVKM
jgi:glycosyltransferase involved in cell wall biosynthesis